MRFRKHRYPTEFPVTMSVGKNEVRCKVTDINETGARLRGTSGLVRGDKVTLHFSMGRACGVVQWSAGDRAGVAFRPQIPLHMVDAMRYGKTRITGSGRFTSTGLRELR